MSVLVIIGATLFFWGVLWFYGEFRYTDGAIDQFNGDIKIEDLIE